MKPFWFAGGAVLFIFLLIFGIATLGGVSFSVGSLQLAGYGFWLGATLSIGLLIADIFLPVPASLIMIANGALYGWLGGSLVSLVGGAGAAMTGYALGRAGQSTVRRWIGPTEQRVARRFFNRWGILAVIVSRPIPLIAETVAVMTGLARWRPLTVFLSAVIGLLPTAMLYAYSGAYLTQSDYGIWSTLIVVGLGVISWLVGRLWLFPQRLSA